MTAQDSRDLTSVVLPMKAFASAKSRLRSQLSDAARIELARAMFRNVVNASLHCHSCIQRTFVVTNGSEVAGEALALGAEVLWDPAPGMTLGALMDWALQELTSRGFKRSLVLMSDLPRVQAEDIGDLCTFLDTHDCVIVPDRRGQSTNALAVHLPWVTQTAFGLPDSCHQHAARARALGLRGLVLPRARLGHDVDVADDLNFAAVAPPSTRPTTAEVASKP